jgi:hypothetical protein
MPGSSRIRIVHDVTHCNPIPTAGLAFDLPSADYLIVEGSSQGKMSGKPWTGGKTPGRRFCNVFKFRDGRISSLHIYFDPDYTGEDEARFRWGKNRKW